MIFFLKVLFTLSFFFSVYYFFYKTISKFLEDEKIEVKILSALSLEMFFLILLCKVLLGFKIFNFFSVLLISIPFYIFILTNLKELFKKDELFKNFHLKKNFLLFILFIYISFTIYEGLITPPLSTDSLNVHMFLAGEMVQKGRIEEFEYSPALNQFYFHPNSFETFVALLMLPMKSDFFSNISTLPFLFIFFFSLIIIFKIFKIEGLKFQTGIVLIFLTPAFFSYIPTQYSDIPFSSLLLSGTAFFLLYYFENKKPYLFLSFLNFSFSIAFKTIAILPLFLFFIFLIFLLIKRKQIEFKTFIIFFLIFTLCSFHYIKMFFLFGNPIYPFPLKILNFQIGKVDPVLEIYIKGSDSLKKEAEERHKIKGLKKIIAPIIFTMSKVYSQSHEALGKFSLLFSIFGFLGIIRLKDKFLRFFFLVLIFSFYLQFFYPSMEGFRLFFSLSYSRYLVFPNTILLIFSLTILEKYLIYQILFFLGIFSQFFLTLPYNWFKIHTILIFLAILLSPIFLFLFLKYTKKILLFGTIIFSIISPFLEKKRDDLRFFFWKNHTHIPPISRITFDVSQYFWEKGENILVHIPLNFNVKEFIYIYTFMGKNFKNNIYPLSEKKANNNFLEWKAYIDKRNIKYLVFSPPLNFKEFDWIKENSNYFKLVFLNEYFYIFKYINTKNMIK